MSNTTAPAPTVDVEYLRSIGSQIAALDEQISAASGSEAAMRNSVVTTIATENAAAVDTIFQQFMATFRTLPTEVVVGFTHRFEDEVNEELGAQISELVDGRVKQISESVKGDVTPLKEQRKKALEIFNSMKLVLETIGHDTSSVPVPKRAGGRPAGGRSGGGAKKTGLNKLHYRFAINDALRPPSQNDMSSLAFYSTMGCAGTTEAPERWGVAQFKEYLAEQGVKLGGPGEGHDEWRVTLPNGKVVSARRLDENNEEDKEIFDAARTAENTSNDDNDNDEDETPTPTPEASPVAPVEQPAGEEPPVA